MNSLLRPANLVQRAGTAVPEAKWRIQYAMRGALKSVTVQDSGCVSDAMAGIERAGGTVINVERA